MTPLKCFLRPALLPAGVATAVLAVALTTGCASPASGPSAAGSAASASTVAVTSSSAASHTVYFAEGGDVRGPVVHEPRCAAGCGLSGDGTAELYRMTWSRWTQAEAVGTGTEKLDDCRPNCASGKLYSVKVIVKFTRPIHVCIRPISSRWYWSRVYFTWPEGLPKPFRGANAPISPLVYTQIAAQSKSCAA